MAAPLSIAFLFFCSASSLFIVISLLLSLYLKAKKRSPPPPAEAGERKDLLSLREDLINEWLPSPSPSPPPPRAPGEDRDQLLPAAAGFAKEEDKRKKRKGKKKRTESRGGPDGGGGECAGEAAADPAAAASGVGDGAMECIYPFSSFASATQRKIKVHYDQLVQSNKAKALTMAQVAEFISCLVDAKNELQQRSEVIQRSFKIKKALLFKADRSSFDRLCQQVYKLEAEHKRLEEDAAVYNLLQEQLKLSPAYQTMLEIGANMEMRPKPDESAELPDISFEELLAQEKKDSFWQKNGKLRSCRS